MIQILSFLVYYTVFSAVCALLYKLLIDRKTQPSFCRRGLVDMLWISWLVVPMCKITNLGYFRIDLSPALTKVLLLLYITGVIIFSSILVINLIRLKKIKNESTLYYLDGIRVYLHSKNNLGCFSWYRYVFMPEDMIQRNQNETKIILAHEHAHVYLAHWLDLIAVNLFLIFQWFNPFMWYFKRELQRIHECEADLRVITEYDIDQIRYEKFLIREASTKQAGILTNNLNFSALKFRLLMLNCDNLKSVIVDRYSLTVGIATLLVIFF